MTAILALRALVALALFTFGLFAWRVYRGPAIYPTADSYALATGRAFVLNLAANAALVVAGVLVGEP